MQQRVQMRGAAQDLTVGRHGRICRCSVGKCVIAAAGQRQAAVGHGGVQRVQQFRVIQIVCVAKGVPPCAQLLGAAQSGCTGRADTAVGLVHGHKPLVARRNGIAQGGGTIRGAVVHQNAPKGVKFLRGNGIGAGGQKRRRVMYRHNDCNLAGLHFVTSA